MTFDQPVQSEIDYAPEADDEAKAARSLSLPPVVIVPAMSLALAACGGGGGGAGEGAAAGVGTSVGASAAPLPVPPAPITGATAGRFLAQSTMGAAPGETDSVTAKGYDGWLGEQFNMPRSMTFFDTLLASGIQNVANSSSTEDGFDAAVWKQLLSGNDQLRQRMGTALLSILVVGIGGVDASFRQFAVAAYMDILWDNAFGNFRTILEKISTNVAMGKWLTFWGNRKANAAGAQPDENYARELMQLFTIGLYQLNLDGTQKLANGRPIESYTQDDVAGLARVFTGWTEDGWSNTDPAYTRRPMIQVPSRHELGTKVFLGTTIPANTDGVASLKIAIDTIFAHPNVAPFISKQLIQRLVTSNPSPAYVRRVATVFENNGSGVRGDLRAVLRAILLDTEARDDAAAASSTTFGKLREPVLRFTAMARAFSYTSPSDKWPLGITNGVNNSLSQTVGRSPSVFNFFRPGYVPPNTSLAAAGLVAPEFQITSEPSVMGYLNFMIWAIGTENADHKFDFSGLLAIAADSQALLNEINLRVAANQVSAATIAQLKPAIDSFSAADATNLRRRVNTALILITASPEFITLK